MTEWEEDRAPFFKVATIFIPRQEFDTLEQTILRKSLLHALARPSGASSARGDEPPAQGHL